MVVVVVVVVVVVAFSVPCAKIKISREVVNQFPFTFVSPLAAQHDSDYQG